MKEEIYVGKLRLSNPVRLVEGRSYLYMTDDWDDWLVVSQPWHEFVSILGQLCEVVVVPERFRHSDCRERVTAWKERASSDDCLVLFYPCRFRRDGSYLAGKSIREYIGRLVGSESADRCGVGFTYESSDGMVVDRVMPEAVRAKLRDAFNVNRVMPY